MSEFNSTSQPIQSGPCVNCGGQTYIGMTHSCVTSLLTPPTPILTGSSAMAVEISALNAEIMRLRAAESRAVNDLASSLKAHQETNIEVARLRAVLEKVRALTSGDDYVTDLIDAALTEKP